ncbi:LemA family protein [Candidatus Saccharibacteria bacterium]|nr:LemA family protein [Candidatus Saccharibacteria bacterium]MBR5408884.1 LemA family protein [Candidatus Saccharibacteria bacterium]
MIVAIIIGCIALIIIAFIWGSYNSLVKTNERVNEAWSDITVQLKRRSDLIPNLVETVKGYAKHEKSAIDAVSEARAKMMGARSVKATADADKSFMGALSRIMAVSEAYPELKADKNFQQLSSELSDTEDKIQAARRFYNAGAKELNTKIKVFPINLFKGFGFKAREYYEVAESEKAKIQDAPEVKF